MNFEMRFDTTTKLPLIYLQSERGQHYISKDEAVKFRTQLDTIIKIYDEAELGQVKQ